MLKKKLRNGVWVVVETFELLGDHINAGDPSPYAIVCHDHGTCMRQLRKAIRDRVEEDLEGSDADNDEVKAAVDEVLERKVGLGREGEYECVFRKEDRVAVWRVFQTEIKGKICPGK